MIPKLHYLSQGNTPQEHLANIQNACTSGAELVLLQLQALKAKKLLPFAEEAREITAHFQTRLIIQDDYKIAKTIKADGVHFEKNPSSFSTIRKHLYSWQLIGATAHHLEKAQKLIPQEIDYLYLGPFKNSVENPTTKALGISGLTLLQEALNTATPLLAFGEIDLQEVKEILTTGISGLAVDEAITKNFNSIREFHRLLKASSTQEQRHSFQ
ncbi:thiamine phosphate synthase [Mesonia mobilis]|uniref:Thiamine phosphate synthase/TenI domain-containing protein n=1 Tax=Mesonia mobilis TaxID=369791 RepID=A0ABQ3BLM8_9FLAO|nr:thiamine phosphate synthase [Mesonia mobilis]GGZ49790.1 hypothetical protein GCM10008088_09060 [Mesonia mobilis]